MAEGDSNKNEKNDDPNIPNSNAGNDPLNELQAIENMVLNPDINLENLVEEASNEYENLNKTLDEIDTWMTTLESRNDTLYSELQDLLKSSKETRQELKLINESSEDSKNKDDDKSKT